MLGNATSLTNATVSVSLSVILKERFSAIIVLAVSSILVWVVIMVFNRWNGIRQVENALINFATSWESLQGNKRLNMQRDILPVVKKGKRIEETITKVPTTITSVDLSCASDIANRLNIKVSSFERNVQSSSYGSTVPQLDLGDMDKLAKRARKCAEELGRWWGRK